MTNAPEFDIDWRGSCAECIYRDDDYVGCGTCIVATRNERHPNRYCPEEMKK